MSIAVPIDQLYDEVGRWGFCYLVTVSDDGRPHLLALRPGVVERGDDRVLSFDAGGGRACHNAARRPTVTLAFPPADHSDGYSLVVDGTATGNGSLLEIRPSHAVLHRPAP